MDVTGDMGGRSSLPHRRRRWLLGVVVPVLVVLAGHALVAAWSPRLSEEVVTHWGSGGPDATGSPAGLVVPLAVLAWAGVLVCGLFAVRTGRTAMVRRLALGIAVGLATLHSGLMVAFVHVQLDATSPEQVADPGSRIFAVCVLAAILGGVAAALAGRDPQRPSRAPVPADAVRVPAGAVWHQHLTPSRRGQVWGRLGAAGMVLLGVGLGAASGSWWVGALVVLPAPLLVLFRSWRVRVDADGLTVRADLGWPRQHVPAAEVERADVVTVDPFGQFGGWGLRVAPDVHGTVGVVVRKGEGIAVQRTGGRRFIVTVDDAATGAGLLNTYAEQARAQAEPRTTD